MKNLERIKNMTDEELIDFFVKYETEDSPWITWLDTNYCRKCELIVSVENEYNREMCFAPCELGDCPFGMKDLSSAELVKIWLEQESWE